MGEYSDERSSDDGEEQSESGEGESDVEKEDRGKKGEEGDEFDEQYENICLMFENFDRDTIKDFYIRDFKGGWDKNIS